METCRAHSARYTKATTFIRIVARIRKISFLAMEQVLEQFIDHLIEEKGFSGVDSSVLKEIKNDLNDQLEDHINAAILEHMPSDKLPQFEAKLDSGSAEEIQTFCKKAIPNLDEVTAGVLLKFRQTYLGI